MNDLHERKHGVLEECSSSERPLCCLGDVLPTLRPHASQNLDNLVITAVIFDVMIITGFLELKRSLLKSWKRVSLFFSMKPPML